MPFMIPIVAGIASAVGSAGAAVGSGIAGAASAIGGAASGAAGAIGGWMSSVVIPTGVITSGGAASTVTGITGAQLAGGLLIGGTAIAGGANAIAQGNALAGTYAYNAAVMEENAKRATAEAEYNRQQKLRQLRGVMGNQRAAFGSAGIIGGTGSALDIAMDTQAQGDLEAAWIEYNGKATAGNYLAQANQSRVQASTARKQGWVNAGLTILGTAATSGLGGKFTSSLGGNNAGNITRMSGGFNTSPFNSTMIA